MINLSQKDKSVVVALLSTLRDNLPVALNPGDSTALAAINLFLDLSNKSSVRYPALHAGLASAASANVTQALQDTPRIVDLGRTSGGVATSRTWIGARDLPLLSGAATLVLDAASKDPLACGTTTTLGEGLVQVATDSASKPASQRLTALTLYHIQNAADQLPRFGAISRTLTAADTTLSLSLQVPVISIQGHTRVVIGLNRPQGYNPDCDYNFLEDAPISAPPLLVPFVGSVSNLPYAIKGIGTDGRINALTIQSLIYAGLSTSAQSLPLLPDSLPLGCFSSAQNPYTIGWSFPYLDPQEPIVYGAASGALDTASAFLFQFTVPVNDPSSPFVFTICSKDTPGQPSVQCIQINDLQFTWHCVADGTKVTLADGSKVDIGTTTAAMRVRTGSGSGTLAVEANWVGSHSGRNGNVIRLVTDAGHTLVLTAHHPVASTAGLVFACDLKPGNEVLVENNAIARVRSVDRIEYEGAFWNLMLGNASDRQAGAGLHAATFIANGIVVGDFNALGNQYRRTRRDFDYMQARLPSTFHKDYESALTDIAR